MSPMVPSHPDDEKLRIALLVELRQRREAAHVTLAAVARQLRVGEHSVASVGLHRPANPRVETLVRYSRPLGFTLVLDLDVDVPFTAEETTLQQLGFPGTAMVARLRRIREGRGISRLEVEAKHGWSYDTFARVEFGNREPYLSTLQRYARVLDLRLDARWESL